MEGDGLPPAKPAPAPAPLAALNAAPAAVKAAVAEGGMVAGLKAGLTAGLTAATEAVASATEVVASVTGTEAKPQEKTVPVVAKTAEQLTNAGAKSLLSKNFIISTNCEDNVKITRSGTEVSGARFNLILDPNNVPPSVMETSKRLMSMGSGVHTMELFIPDPISRKDAAFYYAELMKVSTLLSKSS